MCYTECQLAEVARHAVVAHSWHLAKEAVGVCEPCDRSKRGGGHQKLLGSLVVANESVQHACRTGISEYAVQSAEAGYRDKS